MRLFSHFNFLFLLCFLMGCNSILKRDIRSKADLNVEDLTEKCFFKNGRIKEACINIQYKNTCEDTERVKCIKTFDEKIIPVSILTRDEIDLVKHKVSNFKTEFYNDIESGGHPRAYYLAGVLANHKVPIHVGQIRVTGEFTYKDEDWESHLAPFVYLKKGKVLQKLIIDPAVLHKKIEHFKKWLSVIGSSPNKLTTKFFGPYIIFNYTIDPSNSLDEKELEKSKDYIVSHSFYELRPKYSKALLSLLYLTAITIREE